MKTFIRMLKDESGASAAEYALILAIIGSGDCARRVYAWLGNRSFGAMNNASNCINGTDSSCDNLGKPPFGTALLLRTALACCVNGLLRESELSSVSASGGTDYDVTSNIDRTGRCDRSWALRGIHRELLSQPGAADAYAGGTTKVAVAAAPLAYGSDITPDKVRFVDYPEHQHSARRLHQRQQADAGRQEARRADADLGQRTDPQRTRFRPKGRALPLRRCFPTACARRACGSTTFPASPASSSPTTVSTC